jgi:ubiquinol-cytochrome c reductase cytochrome c1 subunit
MTRRIILAVLVLFSTCVAASEDSGLMPFKPDLSDQASLQRGARIFTNYCLSCHSAKFMRFNRVGEDLGIPESVMKSNLMFVTDKIGATMKVAMRSPDAKSWFGVAPPDLSVEARARGASWLYSYLMSFYRDPNSPTGVNNLVFTNVKMPDVLWRLQGWQQPIYKEVKDSDGNSTKIIAGLKLTTPGQESKGQFAGTVGDLVNFLVYMGEPVKLKRYTIGIWVIAYLLVLLVIVYLLKREYWKDVH